MKQANSQSEVRLDGLNSQNWAKLLSDSISDKQYVGKNAESQLILTEENTQRISLREIEKISRSFYRSEVGVNNQMIAHSIQIIAQSAQKKHYSGINKPLKIFKALINGFKGQGFTTIEGKLLQLAKKILRQENGMKVEGNIISYQKGIVPTIKLIATVKEENEGLLGRGAHGKVQLHRQNERVVVKKSNEDLTKEFKISEKLDHPCIVKSHQLYVKEYHNSIKIYKLVMEKIEGKTIGNLSHLSEDEIRLLLSEAKETLKYLFTQDVFWSDVNPQNIFQTDQGHLKICDLGWWEETQDPVYLAKNLLLGAMVLTRNVLNAATFSESSRDPSQIIKKIYLTEQFFKERVDEYDITTALILYDHKPWMQSIDQQLKVMSREEMLHFLESYMDNVMERFHNRQNI